MFTRRTIKTLCMLVVIASLGIPATLYAAAYPAKPVTVVVPFSPGGGNDILMRLVAKHINKPLGQSLIVENKPGAGGQIGWTALSKARPDGYTIGATSLPSMILIKSLRPNVPFKLDDFQYICNFQIDPIVWVVQKESRFHNARAVMEYARENPGKLNVAGDGPQSNVQLQHLVAAKMLKMETNFVPYSGSGPALTALMGGKVELAAATLSAAIPHIESGRIVPVVVFYEKRVPSIKETPTSKEIFGENIPSIGMALRGVAAPKRMKPQQVAALEKAFKAVAESKEFIKQAESLGLNIQFIGSKESSKLVEESSKLVEKYKDLF